MVTHVLGQGPDGSFSLSMNIKISLEIQACKQYSIGGITHPEERILCVMPIRLQHKVFMY